MQNGESVHYQAHIYNTSEYYSDIIKEYMHNSKSLWKSLKLLLPSKLESVAKSFIINDVFENNPNAIPTAFNDFLLVLVKALWKLLWLVKHLFSNVEY